MSELSFVGKLNRYTCQLCGSAIITKDVDDGVTPFLIDCVSNRCQGMMQSACYRPGINGTPTYIWRRPVASEFEKASEAMQHHYNLGGLVMAPAGAQP
jgi:hypothetical protein